MPHGFLRSPDVHVTWFDAPGAGLRAGLDQGSVAYSINDWNVIAGLFQDSSYVFHAFVRSPDGPFATFDAPRAGTGAFQGTQALDINLVGTTAGFYVASSTALFGRPMGRSRISILRVRITLFPARKLA